MIRSEAILLETCYMFAKLFIIQLETSILTKMQKIGKFIQIYLLRVLKVIDFKFLII